MQRLGVAVLTVFVLVLLLAGGVRTFGRPSRGPTGETVGYHLRLGAYDFRFGGPGQDGFYVLDSSDWYYDSKIGGMSYFRCRLTHAELAAGAAGLVGVVYVLLLACDSFTKSEPPRREPD